MKIVRRLSGVLQAGLARRHGADVDWEAIAADFESEAIATDIELIPARELSGPRSYRGRDGIVEFMRTWTEDFDDWSIEDERLIDAPGDRVVALASQTAIGKGSSVPVELRYGMVFELEDGQVIRIRNYLDPNEALEAAGVSE